MILMVHVADTLKKQADNLISNNLLDCSLGGDSLEVSYQIERERHPMTLVADRKTHVEMPGFDEVHVSHGPMLLEPMCRDLACSFESITALAPPEPQ